MERRVEKKVFAETEGQIEETREEKLGKGKQGNVAFKSESRGCCLVFTVLFVYQVKRLEWRPAFSTCI
jgi:hypothetical protein